MTTATFSTKLESIAGVSVCELANQFGTPTYVYDAAVLDQRITDLKQFDVIRFAQKACSNLSILDHVRRRDVLVDAVSAGEIRRAFQAGFLSNGDPPPIVFCADIFDRASLELVVEHGLQVNCGSPDMIDQLGEVAPGSHIWLRINPGFGHGHSQKTNTGGDQSKHGIWYEQLDLCLQKADRHGVAVTGIHMHIGSGTDFEHLSQVCTALEKAALQVGRTVTSVSVGGGLPTPYQAGESHIDIQRYFQMCDAARQRTSAQFGHDVSLEIEPGRFLAAECGYLISEIRAIKQMGDNTFYLVDAGFNNLARPILYGSYHPMAIAPAKGAGSDKHQPVIVGGPLCESGDIFTQQEGGFVCKRSLPLASVGDYLVIECAGAYGAVMGSNYNSQPLAAEVLLRDGKIHLVRQRQTFDDIVRNERIPSS